MADEPTAPRTVRILGFEIEKRTSFTSLAAFLLSVWGVTQAFYFFLRGSDLELILPDRVIAFVDACHAKSFGEILNFVVPITVINSSPSDYSSVLRDVRLTFELDKSYLYDSEAYVNIGSSTKERFGVVGCDTDPELGFYIEERESVPAEVIAGGTSYVRLMMFVPSIPVCESAEEDCYRQNYLKASHGISMMNRVAKSTRRLSFDIAIEYDDDEKDQKSCTIIINDQVVKGLQSNRSIDGFCLRSG